MRTKRYDVRAQIYMRVHVTRERTRVWINITIYSEWHAKFMYAHKIWCNAGWWNAKTQATTNGRINARSDKMSDKMIDEWEGQISRRKDWRTMFKTSPTCWLSSRREWRIWGKTGRIIKAKDSNGDTTRIVCKISADTSISQDARKQRSAPEDMKIARSCSGDAKRNVTFLDTSS